MARIRTIKPDFFTSEDIVALSPLARLLYIAIWLEADREGRLVWRPGTLKLRYLPGDECSIDELAAELIRSGLVVLYEADGQQLAHVPTFTRHQIINNREMPSTLPHPPDVPTTRDSRVIDACSTRAGAIATPLVGKERKGMEGKGTEGNAPAPPARAGSPDDSTRRDNPQREANPSAPKAARGARTAAEPSAQFEAFWSAWPRSDRKGGRAECVKFWEEKGLEVEGAGIVAHVAAMARTEGWTKQNGEFVPAPLVYLRGRRWDGAELPAPGQRGGAATASRTRDRAEAKRLLFGDRKFELYGDRGAADPNVIDADAAAPRPLGGVR